MKNYDDQKRSLRRWVEVFYKEKTVKARLNSILNYETHRGHKMADEDEMKKHVQNFRILDSLWI